MNVLLATATVDPGQTPVVTLRDPAERLAHYAAATMLWARKGPFDAIVICENSGRGERLEELAPFVEKEGKSFECLRFSGNRGSWEFGKGHGEGGILAHAILKSKLIQEESTIWKVTGRLFVENADELVRLHAADQNVMDPGNTRFFKISTRFFIDHMVGLYRQVNDHRGVSIEVAYDRALEPLRKSGEVVAFRKPHAYVGQDAGSGNWHRHFPGDVLQEARLWRDQTVRS